MLGDEFKNLFAWLFVSSFPVAQSRRRVRGQPGFAHTLEPSCVLVEDLKERAKTSQRLCLRLCGCSKLK
jgi:hypothetical protein